MSRQLNAKQILILKLALRFRYLTTDNLATHRNITQNSAYSALEILHSTGYLGKIHDSSYRLQNKSARYYLTKQALDYLRREVTLEEVVWKNRKNDHKRSTEFIDQQVAIHIAYNELRVILGYKAKILTGTETYAVEGIIKPLPGLLVETEPGKCFFVDLADGQHLFLAKKRIRKYIENYNKDEWVGASYPDVYIIRASSPMDRTRLRKNAEQRMDDAYLDEEDFSFFVLSGARRLNA